MRSSLFAVALIACLSACASAPPTPDTEGQTSIIVDYRGDVEAAREAVLVAFERAGVREVCEGVQDAPSCRPGRKNVDPTLLEGTASRGGQHARVRAWLQWRPVPGVTAITLTGRHRGDAPACSSTRDGCVGPQPGGEMTSRCTGTCGFFWERMQQIAQDLRTDDDG